MFKQIIFTIVPLVYRSQTQKLSMMNSIDSNRILHVKGGFNFRDLGGLPTKDGKVVKKDIFFRTDELGTLQDSDLELLSKLNVQTIVDFRTDQERAKSIDKVPSTCKQEIHLDIVSGNMETFVAEIEKGTADMKQLMFDLYKDLVLGDNGIAQFVKFFEIIQNPDNAAIIYHCTAGKDRTGIATALILYALNVDLKEIEDDYLLSNVFLKDKYAAYIAKEPKFEALLTVEPDYLYSALDAIKDKYASLANYLKDILKVDIGLMRRLYTE